MCQCCLGACFFTDLVVPGPLSQAVLETTPASEESSSSGGVSSEQTVLILREELEIEEEFEGLQEVEKFRCRGRQEGEGLKRRLQQYSM